LGGNKIREVIFENIKRREKMKELSEMNFSELQELQKLISEEIQKRKLAEQKIVSVSFETCDYFDPRKHGGAYVAIVTNTNGKIERQFIELTNRTYDSKRKTYKAIWNVELPVGTKIEARLNDGSWKNEDRDYYEVTENGLEKVSRSTVLGI